MTRKRVETPASERLGLIGRLARSFSWPRIVFAIIFMFFVTGILFPFDWMVSSSFKT